MNSRELFMNGGELFLFSKLIVFVILVIFYLVINLSWWSGFMIVNDR